MSIASAMIHSPVSRENEDQSSPPVLLVLVVLVLQAS